MKTSLLPQDESRPLENATLTTPRSYLTRRELRGIIMWHFIEGWARGNWTVAAIQLESFFSATVRQKVRAELPFPKNNSETKK
jgi:hypothetical protein